MKIIAPAAVLALCALSSAAQAQTRATSGPLAYEVTKVMASRGMGDRHPVCAGPGEAFLIVLYTVKNTGAAPQPVAAMPHLVLDAAAGRMAPDKSALSDLGESLPERESPGAELAAGASIDQADVFEVARDSLGKTPVKLLIADKPALTLPPEPVAPWAAPTCD